MRSPGALPVARAYRSLAEVIAGLAALEQEFLARRDRRGVFVSAYLSITRELKCRIEAGRFHDGAWVSRYAVAFADLFRRALAACESGDRAACPGAWRLALDASAAGAGLAIQDLVLGINAHINHDLPLALREVGVDPGRGLKHADHTEVNAALRVVTHRVRDWFLPLYATGLGVLDGCLAGLLEGLTGLGFRAARERAWRLGVALAGAATRAEAARLAARIDARSVRLGRRALAPNPLLRTFLKPLRALEQRRPWWECVGAPAPGRERINQ